MLIYLAYQHIAYLEKWVSSKAAHQPTNLKQKKIQNAWLYFGQKPIGPYLYIWLSNT